MKFLNTITAAAATLLSLFCYSQTDSRFLLRLKNESFVPAGNITENFTKNYNGQAKKINGKSYCILQFESIPLANEREELLKNGIKILEYIPEKAYIVEISNDINLLSLKRTKARAIIDIEPKQKIDLSLLSQPNNQPVELLVALYNTVNADYAFNELSINGFTSAEFEYKEYNILRIKTTSDKLMVLASYPFIQSVEKAPPPPTPLLNNSRTNARVNMVQSTLPGGLNLTGEGVGVQINEVLGFPQPHIDFADHLIGNGPGNDYHSTHVHGIVGGNGLVAELYKGYAPKAKLFSRNANLTGPSDFLNNGVVLSNNSYASGGPCSNIPFYSTTHYTSDRQAIDYPSLQIVFAIGNSGTMVCNNNYPPGFNTVESGQGSSKSVIGVGSTNNDGTLSAFSSKGPVPGGRMKPDIVASGSRIASTVPTNGYAFNGGTSMAAPAVTGSLALLYQRYKQLHNNINPPSALMKAILCNTASDLGNPGPDFSFGFGWINVYAAVKAINENNYLKDSVTHQSIKTHTFNVPAGTARMKVLLYWQDWPASPIVGSRALVNDLDLKIVSPKGDTLLPYLLDTTAANVNKPATRGEDHVNNIEQIVVDFPNPGDYTIRVRGTEIPLPLQQDYFVTYEINPDQVQLTFPFGKESLVPGELTTIQWDSWGEPTSNFTLSFSPDNGNSWQIINNNITAAQRQLEWLIPNNVTDKALIKLTRNSDGKTSVSGLFAIIGVPVVTLSPAQCPGHITINWNTISGASSYEVMIAQNGDMISVDTTSGNTYTFRNLSEDISHFVTVRAIINTSPGRRAIAIARKPDNGTCSSPLFDNDLKADKLVTHTNGRKYTSTEFNNQQEIVFKIKNLDDQPVSSFTVSYSVNNGNWISEIINIPIPAIGTYTHTFGGTYDFSQPGEYSIRLVVKNAATDLNTINDTIFATLRNIDNAPIAIPYIENFETAVPKLYTSSFTGLAGAEHFDFEKISGSAVLSFSENELTDSTGRSLKLKLDQNIPPEDYLIGTFNLSSYHAAVDAIGLEFTYRNTSSCNCAADDKISIRGKDTDPWIEIAALNPASSYNTVTTIHAIELNNYLKAAGQEFSPSFQVRFSQRTTNHNYLFDNIKFYSTSNEVVLKSIDSLAGKVCGHSSASPIRLTIRNASYQTIGSIKAHYKIDGGNIITETVPDIAGASSLAFIFSTTANLSSPGTHIIEAWVTVPGDLSEANNYQVLKIYNRPIISSFPFLENFESFDGTWNAAGINSSWQMGTPTSATINMAASGKNAWKTNLTGNHTLGEISSLYSPCIDYRALQNPMISFSLAMNIDSCRSNLTCDFFSFQSSNDGVTFRGLVPDTPYHYNWSILWRSKRHPPWQVVTNKLPATTGISQFRFLFYGMNYTEGVGVDDIHIYEDMGKVYDTIISNTNIEKNITGGSDWIYFMKDQKVIVAINPNNQNLGNVTLSPFIKNNSPAATFHGQYYLNRNFVIQSEKALTDSIGIRLYFLDTEADSLLYARNCPKCAPVQNAYRFGISQYNSPKKQEQNDIISDNVAGDWSFIEPAKVKTVPYRNGYYAEFKVKNLSEFWINNGGAEKKNYLPVNMLSFTGKKNGTSSGLLEWTTASEINISKFEIEVAKGNVAFEQDNYTKVAEVASPGASTQSRSYSFTDNEPGKQGAYYYRLKAIDEFGKYSYSKSVVIVYGNELVWQVYPNPSDGLYYLLYQLDKTDKATMTIYNTEGKPVYEHVLTPTGYIQREEINLKKKVLAKGIYFARVQTSESKYSFKLILQ